MNESILENNYHKSVLTKEVIQYLSPVENGVYIDATFGAGGHTRAILETNKTCTVIAFDWDKNALEHNGQKLIDKFGDRLQLISGNFGRVSTLLKKNKIDSIDGILADFGTSQFQIHNLPGFSFNVDSPLDMRMSPGHFKVTAYDIINRASENELAQIFYTYGQETKSRKIARAIVEYRQINRSIVSTKELANVILKACPGPRKAIHPATKVFQALRIVVNDELNNIKSLLAQSVKILNCSGRIVCISFHSLEDRIVKQFFKENRTFNVLTPKVVTASVEEIDINPSSRSAKLRAAQKVC